MRRMDVAVAGTKWCSGIRTEKLANSLRGDHFVFSKKVAAPALDAAGAQ